MRAITGRSYWGPRERIGHLRRFAFIGDSYVFGQGVGPDETLPAAAERHMNDAAPGALIEAVNLGVCGYNLWNDWLSFKRLPPVYDAAVLSLCSNDAWLFGRTYRTDYGGATVPYWERAHPFHAVVASCFDDIAEYSRANGLAIAICYYNMRPPVSAPAKDWSRTIAESITELCATRDLLFIDIAAHLEERRIPFSELVVGDADFHPSKLAHDAAARHLALTLRGKGWLGGADVSNLAATPGNILAVARELEIKDRYPPDMARLWAASALESKRRVAQRAAPENEKFRRNADRAAAQLAAEHADWQMTTRASAFLRQAMTIEDGIGMFFNYADEEMLRLEELCHVIGKADWMRLIAALPPPARQRATTNAMGEIGIARRIAGAIETGIAGFPVVANAPDIAAINDLAERARRKAREFLDFLDNIEPQIAFAENAGGSDAAYKLPDLLRDAIAGAALNLDLLRKKLLTFATPDGLGIGALTTIDVTLTTNRVEEKHSCLLQVWTASEAPLRLPLMNQRQFFADGTRAPIRMRFSLMYRGRAIFQLSIPPSVAGKVEADIHSVQIYNVAGSRKSLNREDLTKDKIGRLVTPDFCLV